MYIHSEEQNMYESPLSLIIRCFRHICGMLCM
jgi:hypothetical protein